MAASLELIAGPARGHASSRDFADAMSALASGVVVVTCRLGDRPWGTTVTAFASVSADPPTVLVSLDAKSSAVRAIDETRRFGVSILGDGQAAVARHAAAPGAPKFLERFVDARSAGAPVVAGALAQLDCELVDAVVAEDHVVLFGRVREARALDDGDPLVYHRRSYRTACDPAAERSVACLSS